MCVSLILCRFFSMENFQTLIYQLRKRTTAKILSFARRQLTHHISILTASKPQSSQWTFFYDSKTRKLFTETSCWLPLCLSKINSKDYHPWWVCSTNSPPRLVSLPCSCFDSWAEARWTGSLWICSARASVYGKTRFSWCVYSTLVCRSRNGRPQYQTPQYCSIKEVWDREREERMLKARILNSNKAERYQITRNKPCIFSALSGACLLSFWSNGLLIKRKGITEGIIELFDWQVIDRAARYHLKTFYLWQE